MINELIIHLGDTKTGSTSIQKVLAAGLCKNPGQTILYPGNTNHNALSHALSRKRKFRKRAGLFESKYDALQESDADYGIISAEHFQSVDPAVLHEAIGMYWPGLADRLRLVAYVRPHGDKMLSAFSERVKLGIVTQPLEGFFEELSRSGELDYTGRFEAWRNVFGSRFTLRPFVRAQLAGGDVVRDFFKYVLGHEDFELPKVVPSNSSLTIAQQALMREVHARLETVLAASGRSVGRARIKDAQVALGRILAIHMQAGGLGQDSAALAMPAALVDRFTKRYADDAEALDKGFFDGFPMSDSLERIADKAVTVPQSLEAAAYFSDETIRSIRVFATVLAGLLHQNPVQFKQAAAALRAEAWAAV